MKENIPVLLLKKLTILPSQEVRIELNNELSKKVIDLSTIEFSNKILIVLPSNTLEESPTITDLPKSGVLTLINSKIVLPNNNYRVVLKGLNRVKINNYQSYPNDKSILIGNAKMLYIDKGETLEETALRKRLVSLVNTYIKINPEIDNSIITKINNSASLGDITDIVVTFLRLPKDKKIYYMNEFDDILRAKALIKEINIELEIFKLDGKIEKEIKESFAKEQKEFVIKERIRKLNEELGVSSSKETELNDLKYKIDNFNCPEEVKRKLSNELQRYEYTPVSSPEISMIRTYIDTLLSLPYNQSSTEETSKDKIRKELDKTHYGLEDVKNRIIEYAVLKKNNPDLENPIICLVGAPGIGKTSIARTIATALKRKFTKISLGGLNDSSELIGHRRTYLGSAPGKIISSLIKCETNNPVILLDEVDKLVKDYKGDPASVLLDILDSKQNKDFTDNYIEEAFDLSKCLFILTANDAKEIPSILRDRLELIYLPSYTIYDKKDIASMYLLNTICSKYNTKLEINEDVILDIIKYYTMESGVRELNRLLDKVVRYLVINKIKEITPSDLEIILGNKLYTNDSKTNKVGEVNIIGVTPFGGTMLKVQAAYNNYNSLNITGNVGDKLKDAVNLCLAYLDSERLLDLKKKGLYLNFSGSNLTIDGASGSAGIVTSILSLINDKEISSDIALIGNIDLYGNILKVSKLKEKIITAYNAGIRTIYLPQGNIEDEKDLPLFILKEMALIHTSNYSEIKKYLFKKK
ncbi:MAG: AAA family ATPase [Bacilli bacterium]|nr:AAA family ATPase [Bacilli bacterium]